MYKICYIYLRDSEYATQFVTYFRQKLPKQVEIKMISERQEPMEISEAAIVISDDRQFLEEFSREGIYLSSQPVTDKENEIFMYQKRERIWQNFCEITKMEQEIEGKRRKKGADLLHFFAGRRRRKNQTCPAGGIGMLEIFESALYQYVWCPGIFSGRAKGNAIHLSSGTGRMDSCRGKWESGRIASVACVFLWKNIYPCAGGAL